MRLVYFDFPGRAETPRLVFKLGGVAFDDVRVSREEWPQKWKAVSPSGTCPVLELDDGTIIHQSLACKIYAAQEAGMWPEDAKTAAQMVEVLACFMDIEPAMSPTFMIAEQEAKEKARVDLFSPGGRAHKALSAVEQLLQASKTKFFLSDEIGLVDLDVFTVVGFFTSGFMDGLDDFWLKDFPKIKETRDSVAADPRVAECYRGKENEGVYKAFM